MSSSRPPRRAASGPPVPTRRAAGRSRVGRRGGGGYASARAPDLLLPAILVTVFCCIPGGIAAILYAAGANEARARGDYGTAAAKASTAKVWIIVSVVPALLVLAFYALLILGVVALDRGQTL